MRFTIFTVIFIIFINSSSIVKAEEWRLLPQQNNVPVNKTWTINFNIELEPETVSESTIYVEDKEGRKVPVNLSLDINQQTVRISPLIAYEANQQYTLYVTKGVFGVSGKELKEPVKLMFHTVVYQIASLRETPNLILQPMKYATIEETKKSSIDPLNIIVNGYGEIVWAKEGIVIVKKDAASIIYDDSKLTKEMTSVTKGSELQFLDSNETSVKVQIGGRIGYVHKFDVEIIPQQTVRGQSYYYVSQGELHHFIYQNGKYDSYVMGPSPSFMMESEVYQSWDGVTFTKGKAFQYFNYMPLRLLSNYNESDLNKFIKSVKPNSPLNGLGDLFVKAQDTYQVNALYLLSHAILESSWGESDIAMQKNNLFGINAKDGEALESATKYDSFEHSINEAANYISNTYLNPDINKGNGIYYGGFLGNKGLGMNVKYASDPYWGQKIAGLMYRIDKSLGSKEVNSYKLIMNTVPLYARPEPHTQLASLYRYRHQGTTIAVLEKVEGENGIWYQIVPEYPYEDTTIFVHGDYVEQLPTP